METTTVTPITVVRWPHVQPHYAAWVAAGSPTHCDDEDWDNPARRITAIVTYDAARGPYLDLREWARYGYSIQGAAGATRRLEYSGSVRIRKNGSMGAVRCESAAAESRHLYDAYEAWLSAGKPAQFMYVA